MKHLILLCLSIHLGIQPTTALRKLAPYLLGKCRHLSGPGHREVVVNGTYGIPLKTPLEDLDEDTDFLPFTCTASAYKNAVDKVTQLIKENDKKVSEKILKLLKDAKSDSPKVEYILSREPRDSLSYIDNGKFIEECKRDDRRRISLMRENVRTLKFLAKEMVERKRRLDLENIES